MKHKIYTLSTGDRYDIIYDDTKQVNVDYVAVWGKHLTDTPDNIVTTSDNSRKVVLNRDKFKGTSKFDVLIKGSTTHYYIVSWKHGSKDINTTDAPAEIVVEIVKLKNQLDEAIKEAFQIDGTQTLTEVLTGLIFENY